ncbi:MAG: ornithine cyclodeaminase family protein [Steroidobacteraceae bacterium]
MLFLDCQDVANLLPMADCIEAVARAFAAHADAALPVAPGVLGSQVGDGGFHVKTAALDASPGYFAAKVNANFPDNPARRGLPTIQGVIALFDTEAGRPLALLDSMEITTLRTAAASAVAARYLAQPDAATLLICGCGNQGRAHLRALMQVRRLARVLAHDRDPGRMQSFIRENSAECGIDILPAANLPESFPLCDIGVTCTPACEILIRAGDIRPGQFIAAVGADSQGKQELDPQVLAGSLVVADIAGQAAEMGELQHAIAAKLMKIGDLHAELGQLVTGRRPGRSSARQVFVFDSTGTALQDVAAAAAVYERAVAAGQGRRLSLDGA